MNSEPKGFFASIPQSCTNFEFYKQVVNQSIGKALKYIFLLLLLVAIAMSINTVIKLQKFIKEGQIWAEKNVPEIKIVNGKTQVEVPQPYTVWKDENFIVMIDTTGQYTSIDTAYRAGALLTQSKLIMKQSEVEIREYDLSQIPQLVINKDTISKWAKIAQVIIWIVIPIGTYLYLIVAKWFQIALFSLFTLSLNNTMKTNLKYPQLLSLGIYALTGPLILDLIYAIVGRPNPIFLWIYIAVYVIYLFMAVKHQKPTEPTMPI